MNIEGATRLAGVLRTDISSLIATGGMRDGDSHAGSRAADARARFPPSGQTFNWGGYIFAGGSHIFAGADLFKYYQRIYDPTLVWVRDRVTVNDSPITNARLISPGVICADLLAGSYGVFIRWACHQQRAFVGAGNRS